MRRQPQRRQPAGRARRRRTLHRRPGATAAWSGYDGAIVNFQDGGWLHCPPQEGWLAWCADETALLCRTGGAWIVLAARSEGPGDAAMFGINTEADETDRLSLASDATLLSHAGSSHRLVVNKKGAADTASVVFQKDFSGRAEIGLTGDERLSLKVSADGTNFTEAMAIDNETGKPTFPAAAFLESHCINLYQDSGRMAGNGVNAVAAGAFAFPAYLTSYNGATVKGRAKFITNNSDYGGTAGPLDGQVRTLVDTIRHPTFRRYGTEFWVAEISAGAGTFASLTVGGHTGYLSLFTSNTIRPTSATLHAYVKALDDHVLINVGGGQTARKNGVSQAGSFTIAPAEAWVSLTIHDTLPPYRSAAYQPNMLALYAKTAGNRYLIACPALIGGITAVDDKVGIIAAANSWPA